MKHAFFSFLALIVSIVVIACGSQESKRAEAASGYAAQQTECIAKWKTRAEIDACRDAVKEAWAKPDAGTEGGVK